MYNETKMLQVGINKSLLKEYKVKNDPRVVYLENGKEFQLYISNPTSQTIAAEIYLNGDKISNRLVLRPAEKIWLDRYLDKAKKFKFETYEVDGDAETQKLIEKSHNGEIRVRFYREDKSPRTYTIKSDPLWTTTVSDASIRYRDFDSATTICSGSFGISDLSYNSASKGIKGDAGESCNVSTVTALNCASDIANCVDAITTSCYCSTITDSVNSTISSIKAQEIKDDTIETGRVGAGSHSDQTFEDVDTEFQYWSFNDETIKILPLSQKPVTVNDMQKCYCPECGHRLKNNYKFCPYCGSKIEE